MRSRWNGGDPRKMMDIAWKGSYFEQVAGLLIEKFWNVQGRKKLILNNAWLIIYLFNCVF